MSTFRDSYKAKLREVSNASKASRRKSRGEERKKSRYEEVNKRRLLSNEMSPVVERADESSQNLKSKPLRDTRRKKGDTVRDRLQQWREQRQRQQELEKQSSKIKPTFKVGSGLDRKFDADLFSGKTTLTKTKPKEAQSKPPAPKTVPAVKSEPKVVRNNYTKTANKPGSDKQPSKLEVKKSVVPKKQPSKMIDLIATGKSTSLKKSATTVDLSSKLTAAAAAKRNDLKASPKKFLRATRATTLHKKEPLDKKKGNKMTKASSKSTGELLGQQKRKNASVKEELTDFKPLVVPRVLESFDFSTMDNGAVRDKDNSASDSKDPAISDVLEAETFTKVQSKPGRKSIRKSGRLAALEMDDEEIAIQTDSEINGCNSLKSKRKSLRKSRQLTSTIGCVDDAAIISLSEDKNSEHVKSKRKSTRINKRISHLEPSGMDNTGIPFMPQLDSGDDLITFTPRLSKSVRKSKRLSSSVAKQKTCPIESELREIADRAALTPKLSKRKSLRISTSKKLEDLQISSPNKSGLNAIDFLRNSHVVSNLNKSLLSFYPAIKSDVLETTENELQGCSSPNSGINNVTEEIMEVDAVHGIVSDMDTQIPLTDVTSTPKSAYRSRKSMRIDPLSASSVDEVTSSPEKVLTRTKTPKSNNRSSRGARRSLSMKHRSLKSSSTPAKTPRMDKSLDEKNLNLSGAATPNTLGNIENIPRSNTSRRSARKSTVISVSDEGTAVGRDLELALAYKVEKQPLSAKASRILNELVIEKVEGEKSFFEVSFEDSSRGSRNTSVNCPDSKLELTSSDDKMQSVSTASFSPRRSDELTISNYASNSLTTPKSSHLRHSVASSGFKEPGLPLSAVMSGSHSRRRTENSTPLKTPRQMMNILKKSPMVEMTRRRSRHVSSPAPPKGQYFRDLVHNETERLTGLCNRWNSLMTEQDLGEEVLGQIRSTVGMALLLIEERFKQFTGLVDNYVYDLGEKETTPTDLQGFWDMIYFQVENVDSQFKQLEVLKEANWLVKTASPKVQVALKLKKKTVPKGPTKPKGVKSNFASFRAEMMKRKKAAQSQMEASNENYVEAVDNYC